MLKNLKKLGKTISPKAEIQNISTHGMWILINDEEYFLPFSQFPWFKEAKLEHIYNVQLFHGHHLHWPDLDIDISLDSIRHPELYPLSYS